MTAIERPDRGELDDFEVVWKSGHVDRLKAHQVSQPGTFGGMFGEPPREPRVEFHGEFDGRWRLVLSVPLSELSTIRNVSLTEPEVLP